MGIFLRKNHQDENMSANKGGIMGEKSLWKRA